MRVAYLCSLLLVACGDDSCDQLCEELASRLMKCELAEAPESEVAACQEALSGVSESQCANAQSEIESASCDELADIIQGNCGLRRYGARGGTEEICSPDPCQGVVCKTGRCEEGQCVECTEETEAEDCKGGQCAFNQCVECTEETEAKDCPQGEGCDFNGVCRERCFDDSGCGDFRTCYAGEFCTEPVGTPCTDTDDCGGGYCEDLDAAQEPVEPYCTILCFSSDKSPCPTGYSCEGDRCRP